VGESPRRITNVLLRVSVDPGHGGVFAEYRVDPAAEGFRVALRISAASPRAGAAPAPRPPSRTPQPTPAASEATPEPTALTEALTKDRREAEDFLRRLSEEFNVYGMTDLRPAHPFLHPTFYSFSFRDAGGGGHDFEYAVECANHPDERYKALVREFESFFEAARVFGEFFERGRRGV
jgi:hypothetical protein